MYSFQSLNDKIDQNTNFARLVSPKWLFMVYVTLNFNIQKWKSKHLIFSGDSFFEGTKGNILQTFWAIGPTFLIKLTHSLTQIMSPDSNWDYNHYYFVFKQKKNWVKKLSPLKVSKSQNQIMVSLILPKNWTKHTQDTYYTECVLFVFFEKSETS